MQILASVSIRAIPVEKIFFAGFCFRGLGIGTGRRGMEFVGTVSKGAVGAVTTIAR